MKIPFELVQYARYSYPHAKWLAMDNDSGVYAYMNRPTAGQDSWIANPGDSANFVDYALLGEEKDVPDWKQSLVHLDRDSLIRELVREVRQAKSLAEYERAVNNLCNTILPID